jgi:hypothetical protein
MFANYDGVLKIDGEVGWDSKSLRTPSFPTPTKAAEESMAAG